jgi:hypothetical protein
MLAALIGTGIVDISTVRFSSGTHKCGTHFFDQIYFVDAQGLGVFMF